MIYECTDCKHCLNFGDGLRVLCNHSGLPADEVFKYHPLECGEDARGCAMFDGSAKPEQHSARAWDLAVQSAGVGREIPTYDQLRAWLRAFVRQPTGG
jgi:hypothetical protein